MQNDRFLLLLTRKLAGEATPEELEELNALVAAEPRLKAEVDMYARFWAEQQQAQLVNKELAWQKILQQIDNDPSKEAEETVQPAVVFPLWKKTLRVAAGIALVALLGIGTYQFIGPKSADEVIAGNLVQKQNAKGVKSTIELTDGSKIWLNADSKVQYPASFNGNTREVYLNGEAFFDIARNPDKPFIIHLSNGTVRVLGTSFNIKAYDNEPVVETSVATGKVAFIPKLKNREKADTVFLTPNNKVVYRINDEKVTTLATVSAEDKGWTEGKMVFRSTLFRDIAKELERNFGKRVIFKDAEVGNFRLTGSFQNDSLADILFYLARSKPFTYTITDEEIAISR
jgi:transmembrane sensor